MLREKYNELDRYADVVGDKAIDELYEAANPLDGKEVVHINSTAYGGGVAILLSSIVPLMNDLGIEMGWRQIIGRTDFFVVTKVIHNALQGAEVDFTEHRKEMYFNINRKNAIYTHLQDKDCVIVHDPQPLPLIEFYKKRQPWLWRLHIDISDKNQAIWKMLEPLVMQYDNMIVSMDKYKQLDLKLPQTIIMPSIDPMGYINRELQDSEYDRYMKKYGIDEDKPIIAQISRFDKWKDPIGVVNAFKKVKKEVDCKLIMLGNMASDDPEGQEIYDQLIEMTANDNDIQIIGAQSSYLVNALQRKASVIIQKSIREGFALTVSEALWKGTPVVGGNVGGIPLQIIDGKTGYLVNNIDECANRVIKLLKDPKHAKELGRNGREHVRKNFLVTRHIMDYINLLKQTMIFYKV